MLICDSWIVMGLDGYLAFHRVCRTDFADGEKNLALALLAVIATVNSLLLAFSVISVWDAFGNAEKSVLGEANTIASLGRDVAVFNTAEADHARATLKAYVNTTATREWESMRRGDPDNSPTPTLDPLFVTVGALQPATPREVALLPQIWARANELGKYRRERLHAGEARVPGMLWVVMTIRTFYTILATYVFPRTAFNLVAVTVLSSSLGLVFFLVVAMDRPFAGQESVDPGGRSCCRWGAWNAGAGRCRRRARRPPGEAALPWRAPGSRQPRGGAGVQACAAIHASISLSSTSSGTAPLSITAL